MNEVKTIDDKSKITPSDGFVHARIIRGGVVADYALCGRPATGKKTLCPVSCPTCLMKMKSYLL